MIDYSGYIHDCKKDAKHNLHVVIYSIFHCNSIKSEYNKNISTKLIKTVVLFSDLFYLTLLSMEAGMGCLLNHNSSIHSCMFSPILHFFILCLFTFYYYESVHPARLI